MLDHTLTPFGRRLLRKWVSHPLRDLRWALLVQIVHVFPEYHAAWKPGIKRECRRPVVSHSHTFTSVYAHAGTKITLHSFHVLQEDSLASGCSERAACTGRDLPSDAGPVSQKASRCGEDAVQCLSQEGEHFRLPQLENWRRVLTTLCLCNFLPYTCRLPLPFFDISHKCQNCSRWCCKAPIVISSGIY